MRKLQKIRIIIILGLLLMVLPLAGAFFIDKDKDLEKLVLLNLMVQSNLDTEPEALKAQAILIRTNLSVDPAYSMVEAQKLTRFLKEDTEGFYFKKFQEAVTKTKSVIVRTNKKVEYFPYHKISCGTTRSAKEIENGTPAYLVSAKCQEDILEQGFINVFYFTKRELGGTVKVRSRFDSGYVKSVEIKGEKQILLKGEEFRRKFSLPSSCFYIEEQESKYRIVTKGCGHGFGLSQSMANVLAKKGKKAKEIIKYFYKNVDFYQNE